MVSPVVVAVACPDCQTVPPVVAVDQVAVAVPAVVVVEDHHPCQLVAAAWADDGTVQPVVVAVAWHCGVIGAVSTALVVVVAAVDYLVLAHTSSHVVAFGRESS